MDTTLAGRDLIPFFRKYWQLIVPARPLIYRAFVWIFAVQLLALVEPLMFQKVIDGIVALGANAANHTAKVLLVMLALLFSIGFVTVAKNNRLIFLAGLIEYLLPLSAGKKLLNLPLSFHHTENTGLIVGKVIRGVGNTVALTGFLMFEIVPLIVQIGITLIIFLYWCPAAALVLLPCVILFAYLTAKVKIKMQSTRRERHSLDGDADDLLGQAITNVMTTQAFCQEDRELQAVEKIRDRVRKLLAYEFFEVYAKSDIIRNAIISIGRPLVIFVCALSVISGDLTAGELVFVATLSERIFISCYRIGAIFDRVMEAQEPVTRMQDVMAEPETTPDPAKPVAAPPRFQGRIEYRDIVYAYPRRDASTTPRPPVLKDLQLVIEAGRKIGLVGMSGGGKTTLAKLLMRFYDPNGGAVLIDGIDLRDMRKSDFRRQIGYVPQEVEIYDMTVAENIAYGSPGIEREAIVRAAQAASAHEFISEELENGYDTLVGNRGMKLSGGQRQRLGIARALLIDPPILVFDEATSNCDSMNEQKIHEAMAKISKGRTVIIVAQKLATVLDADLIAVVDHGRIVDIGSHAELASRPGIYRQFASLQRLQEA